MIVTAAEEAKQAAQPPNLSDRQIRVHIGPPEAREAIPADALRPLDRPAARRRSARRPARRGGRDPAPEGHRTRAGALLRARHRHPACFRRSTPRASGRDPRTPPVRNSSSPRPRCSHTSASIAARSNRARSSWPTAAFPAAGSSCPSSRIEASIAVTNVQPIEVGRHLLGAPGGMDARELAFITPEGLRRLGLEPVPAGWLVESRRPLTSDQIADARSLAASAGLTLEVQREEPSFATAMALTTAAGALLALGILALTVGLIRGESAGDLRIAGRDRSHLAHPPHADGHHRRRARAARRAPRRRRRLSRPLGDVLRRPRLSERRAGVYLRSRSSACRWPRPPPAGSSPGVSRPRSPGPSSTEALAPPTGPAGRAPRGERQGRASSRVPKLLQSRLFLAGGELWRARPRGPGGARAPRDPRRRRRARPGAGAAGRRADP